MGDLEAMRRKDPQYLKKLLEIRVNQHKMLNDTLIDMVKRGVQSKSIEMLKEEISNAAIEIANVKRDLDNLSKEDEKVTYSFYNDVNKPRRMDAMSERVSEEEKLENGFYDSIIKHNKTAQFVEMDKLKQDNNCRTKKLMDEFRETANARIQANRFLVNLKDALGIPEIMVDSVSFDLGEKMVSVNIYDFVTDDKMPIMEVLKYTVNEFVFNIDHLKPNGDTTYTEYYSKCKIENVYRDPLEYASDDFSKIQILISYENVDYEASK